MEVPPEDAPAHRRKPLIQTNRMIYKRRPRAARHGGRRNPGLTARGRLQGELVTGRGAHYEFL